MLGIPISLPSSLSDLECHKTSLFKKKRKKRKTCLTSIHKNSLINSNFNGYTSLTLNAIYRIPVFKILLIGSLGAGKTSLLHRFAGEEYQDSFSSTVGVEFVCFLNFGFFIWKK